MRQQISFAASKPRAKQPETITIWTFHISHNIDFSYLSQYGLFIFLTIQIFIFLTIWTFYISHNKDLLVFVFVSWAWVGRKKQSQNRIQIFCSVFLYFSIWITLTTHNSCSTEYLYPYLNILCIIWKMISAALVRSCSFTRSGENKEISPYETLPCVSLKLLTTSWLSHNKCRGIPAPQCAFERAPSDGKSIWNWTCTQYIGKHGPVSWS